MIPNKMTPSERIKLILLEFQIDSSEELSRKIKVDGDLIRNILNLRTKKMSGKVAKGISDAFPVSYKWLMTGEGEIFQKEEKSNEPKSDETLLDEKERIIKILLDRIEEQSRTIKMHEKSIEELSRREPEEKYRGSG